MNGIHNRGVLRFCGISFIALSFFSLSQAQDNQHRLKDQAEETGKAFVSGDFEKLVDLTYPKVVEMLGGRAEMVAFLRKDVTAMESDGFKALSMSAGTATEIKRIGKDLFGVVPVSVKFKVSGGTVTQESFMIGISGDGGQHWTFVDGYLMDEERMKILLPAAANKLDFPKVGAPIFYPDPKPEK